MGLQSSGEGDTLSAFSAPPSESSVSHSAIAKASSTSLVSTLTAFSLPGSRQVCSGSDAGHARHGQPWIAKRQLGLDQGHCKGQYQGHPQQFRDTQRHQQHIHQVTLSPFTCSAVSYESETLPMECWTLLYESIAIRADSEDPIVVEDFAFSEQKNFFAIPPDCKLPLGNLTPRNTCSGSDESAANPKTISDLIAGTTPTFSDAEFAFGVPTAPASLSLIEEVTECSSSSAFKSSNSTPRPQNPDEGFQPKQELQSIITSHIPKILNTMSPRESQEHENVMTQKSKPYRNKKFVGKESPREGRGVRESREMVRPLRQRLRPLDATLPSKSQPGTPRDDEEEMSEGQVTFFKTLQFYKNVLF